MSERDPVVVLLKELDRQVAPRPEFAEALRTRLLVELVDANGAPARRSVPRPRRALLAQHRRPVLAAAVAIAVAAATIAAVVLSRPSPASALDVIHQARRAFAAAPPFEATLRVDLNPDSSNPDVPKGATATVVISYGGHGRFRTQIASVEPRFPAASSPGSYQVFDGDTIATFDSKRNRLDSTPAPKGFRPLDYFSWHGAYPDWERICRDPGSKVLPDARIAGRDARHTSSSTSGQERARRAASRSSGSASIPPSPPRRSRSPHPRAPWTTRGVYGQRRRKCPRSEPSCTGYSTGRPTSTGCRG